MRTDVQNALLVPMQKVMHATTKNQLATPATAQGHSLVIEIVLKLCRWDVLSMDVLRHKESALEIL